MPSRCGWSGPDDGQFDFFAGKFPPKRDICYTNKTQFMKNEKAILAGGCFWGVEELIRSRPGVISTVVGYTGGDVPNATYRNHGTHAEGIAIEFDPERLSY